MKKFLALILSVAMIFALVACGNKEGDTPNTDGDTQQTDTPAAPVDIVIATGGTTGTYYAVGNALVTTIGDKLSLSKLTAVDSGASKANVQLVTANQAQMSILQSDVLNYAHNGSGGETMFDGAADKNSLWVAGVYNETVQLVTAPSITSIEDLKGKTVMTQVDSAALDVLEGDQKALADTFKGGKAQTIGDYNNAFLQLNSGAVDAVACDLSIAQYQIAASPDSYVQLSDALSTEHYGVGFKKGDTEMADAVTKTLKEMYADGTVKTLCEKYAQYGLSYDNWLLK